jgi:DNA-binding transcriptional regulator YhcF (GntR family)
MDYSGDMFADEVPIFQQLAAQIAENIATGVYPEETAVPSATDLAVFYQMNPATASKGVNLLVEQGVLYKKRGIGMFVTTGARDLLKARRREEFRTRFIRPLLHEARILGVEPAELHRLIDESNSPAAQAAQAEREETAS